MAIEGDIDLTENLDFRKDKSTNAMLPAVIKGRKHDMKSLAQKDNQVYHGSDYMTYTYQITSNTQNWSYWTTDYYSIDNTGDEFDYYDIQLRQPAVTTTSATSSIISYVNADQICWNYSPSTPIISVNYNTNGSIYIESDYDEGFTLGDKRPPETSKSSDSIFGDRKIYNDKSVNLSKLVKPKNDNTEIGYNMSSGNWYYHLDYPWDDKDDDEDIEDSFDLRDVPWIKPLYYDSRFRYNDYVEELYEDRDYSSYLTDYRWLRLHD